MNSKILVVEDNEISYILINEIFIKDTVDVLWAKDAKEAFKIYKTNKNVSLIIMDIQLPTISGYEATKIFKKYNPSIPIIAIT
ncbi:MAG: response regulator, partial [Bacteroidota bacterium]|nr:response regulator [Bacteroidota bacterium]